MEDINRPPVDRNRHGLTNLYDVLMADILEGPSFAQALKATLGINGRDVQLGIKNTQQISYHRWLKKGDQIFTPTNITVASSCGQCTVTKTIEVRCVPKENSPLTDDNNDNANVSIFVQIISSTSLSCSAIMFLMSSDSWPPSAATICFFRYSLTSSRLSCMSLFSSISLNTLVVGGESPMLISSTSNTSVAPPGITFPAPRSP
uniref:Uncharacterized protein n=1 Tax=Anopheles culicifacies TaxID=139723 RepID=A0A182MED9_9DIPT